MTPEQIAAEAVGWRRCIYPDDLRCKEGVCFPRCEEGMCFACQEFGRLAVEDQAAAGLVLLTASRAAALLELERRAQMTQSDRIEGTHA